jgi:hypothetical protein
MDNDILPLKVARPSAQKRLEVVAWFCSWLSPLEIIPLMSFHSCNCPIRKSRPTRARSAPRLLAHEPSGWERQWDSSLPSSPDSIIDTASSSRDNILSLFSPPSSECSNDLDSSDDSDDPAMIHSGRFPSAGPRRHHCWTWTVTMIWAAAAMVRMALIPTSYSLVIFLRRQVDCFLKMLN